MFSPPPWPFLVRREGEGEGEKEREYEEKSLKWEKSQSWQSVIPELRWEGEGCML